MAKIHGKSGSVAGVTETVTVTNVTSWTVDVDCDLAEVTNMASSDDWKEFLAGFKGWTGSVECVHDTSDTGTGAIGATTTLTLTMVSGTTLSGQAIINGVSFSQPHDGAVTATYNFTGTGALS